MASTGLAYEFKEVLQYLQISCGVQTAPSIFPDPELPSVVHIRFGVGQKPPLLFWLGSCFAVDLGQNVAGAPLFSGGHA